MNRQQVFDKIVRHAKDQPRKAMLGERCCYLAPNGDRCFIGALLDSEQAESLSTSYIGVSAPKVMSALQRSLVSPDRKDHKFLEDLQGIHDCTDPEDWPFSLEEFAEDYDLDVSLLRELFREVV